MRYGIPTAGWISDCMTLKKGVLWSFEMLVFTSWHSVAFQCFNIHLWSNWFVSLRHTKFCTVNMYTSVSHDECNWGGCRTASKGWASILGLTTLYHKMWTCCKGLCSAWGLGESSGMSQAMETEHKEKGWEGIGWVLLAQDGTCDRPVWLW